MEIKRCVYCGSTIKDETIVPSLGDDVLWKIVATEHQSDCEWIQTRAHNILETYHLTVKEEETRMTYQVYAFTEEHETPKLLAEYRHASDCYWLIHRMRSDWPNWCFRTRIHQDSTSVYCPYCGGQGNERWFQEHEHGVEF